MISLSGHFRTHPLRSVLTALIVAGGMILGAELPAQDAGAAGLPVAALGPVAPIAIDALGAMGAAEALAALLRGSRGVRYVLRETPEGAALAARLLGRPIAEDADYARLADELGRPERADLARELEPRLTRLARLADGGAWDPARLHAESARELAFVPEADGARGAAGAGSFAGQRARFLNGDGGAASPLPRLKVAAVQYPVRGGRTYGDMMGRFEAYVRQAHREGAGLVVFPELFVLDRVDPASPLSEAEQLAQVARHETPRIFARAAELSRELGVAVMSGSFPRVIAEGADAGRIVNTAQLVFPDGRVIFQDKLNLTPDEVTWGWKAGNELHVFDAPWGRSTILICYDSQFPELSARIAQAAPELILVPSMTGAKGFSRVRWAAQARAVEQHAYVVVTGTVDAPGVAVPQFAAQAAFLTPQDEGFPGLLAHGPENVEALVFGDFDLAHLRQSRAQAGLYAGRDQGRRPAPVQVHAPAPVHK